jgi:alpha(1,3/1,4) fucosyltransferase
MHKPKLRLDFTDFGGLNKLNNWFVRILSRDFEVEISDKPDLLIFQESGHLNRLYTCKKLFWTGESIFPAWDKTDYAMTCHFIDNPRHLRFPYYVWGSEATTKDLTKNLNEAQEIFSQKRKFCATVISNDNPKRAYSVEMIIQTMNLSLNEF